MSVRVRVPATTANLGPGLDVLGMALDLWNEAVFTPTDDGQVRVSVEGEGAGHLPEDAENTVAEAALRVYAAAGRTPSGMRIACNNQIPLGSGLGSSSAAILTGMLGANVLLDNPFTQAEILQLATHTEGHPDNVAPALLGGLVVSYLEMDEVVAVPLPMEEAARDIEIRVVLPDFSLPTSEARAVLPAQVSRQDAVANLGRAVLVVEALQRGDVALLRRAMQDRMHQPHRLPHLPGGEGALAAAQALGAAAALSGAGPSVIAFAPAGTPHVGAAMQQAFAAAGLMSRLFRLEISTAGAGVTRI